MRGRATEAWLTAFAAVLGLSEAACQKTNHDAPAAAREVPSASSAPSASVALAAPSDVPAASAVASVAPPPRASASIDPDAIAKLLTGNNTTAKPTTLGTITGARNPNYVNAACGAIASNLRNNPVGTSQTATVNATFVSAPREDDARILAGTRALLRACANAGLRTDPNEAGRVFFSLVIGASGEVSQVDIIENVGISGATAHCMQQRLRNSKLAATGAPRPAEIRVESKSSSK